MSTRSPEVGRGAGDEQLVPGLVLALRERISRGEIPVGAWIRQERVAAEFGVSRTPVREALRLLQAHGVVENVLNRGVRVAMPSPVDLREVLDVAAVLEGHAAARAARAASDPELSGMREAVALFERVVDALRRGGDVDDLAADWHRADGGFHASLVAAAGSGALTRSLEALHGRVPRTVTWTALRRRPELLERNAAEHAEVLAAVTGRDAEAAAALVRRHVLRALELVESTAPGAGVREVS